MKYKNSRESKIFPVFKIMDKNIKVSSELKPQHMAYACMESEFRETSKFRNLKLRNKPVKGPEPVNFLGHMAEASVGP